MITCSVPGCESLADRRGWCTAHYTRARRHDGDPLGGCAPRPRKTPRPARVVGTCSVFGCIAPVLSLGWCQAHYSRARKHDGDPQGGRPWSPGEATEYFNTHITDVTTDCMIWPYGRANSDNYGSVYLGGIQRRVHVAACEWKWGRMPTPGMHAAHGLETRCISTLCWNPNHLRWETPKGNMGDRHRDGTMFFGEASPVSKLRADQVREIRGIYAQGGVTQKALGEQFSVDRSTITQIVSGRTWRALLTVPVFSEA